jgi:hypothetical protein
VRRATTRGPSCADDRTATRSPTPRTAIAQALPRWLRPYLDPTLLVPCSRASIAGAVSPASAVLRWLRRLSAATAVPYDDIVVDGAEAAGHRLDRPRRALRAGSRRCRGDRGRSPSQDIVAALLIISVTLALVRMVSGAGHAYGSDRAAGSAGPPGPLHLDDGA